MEHIRLVLRCSGSQKNLFQLRRYFTLVAKWEKFDSWATHCDLVTFVESLTLHFFPPKFFSGGCGWWLKTKFFTLSSHFSSFPLKSHRQFILFPFYSYSFPLPTTNTLLTILRMELKVFSSLLGTWHAVAKISRLRCGRHSPTPVGKLCMHTAS